jgi:hypothetical protein
MCLYVDIREKKRESKEFKENLLPCAVAFFVGICCKNYEGISKSLNF